MSALLMIVSRNPQPGIQALLANNGYRVRASPRVLGQEDDEEAPAAIIADFDEPFSEGAEICRQLRRRYNVPLVAMSQPDESFEVALLDAGAETTSRGRAAPSACWQESGWLSAGTANPRTARRSTSGCSKSTSSTIVCGSPAVPCVSRRRNSICSYSWHGGPTAS